MKQWLGKSSPQNKTVPSRPTAGFDTSRISSRGRVPSVRVTWIPYHHQRCCCGRNSAKPFEPCWNCRNRRFNVINDFPRLLECLILSLCHNVFAVGLSERGGAERQGQYHSHAQTREPVYCFHRRDSPPSSSFTQLYFADKNRTKSVIAPKGNVPTAIVPTAISPPHCAFLRPQPIFDRPPPRNPISTPLQEDALH